MLLTLAALAAPAGPEGGTYIGSRHGCRFHAMPLTEKGAKPVHASCVWSGSAERFDRFLLDLEGQKERYASLASADIVWERGNNMAIRQVHTHSLLSPREGLVIFTREASDGRYLHQYSLAPDQPPPEEGHVTLAEHAGYWSFREETGERLRIEYRVAYLPGGSVPAALVRAFQTEAVIDSVGEVRRAFLAEAP